MKLIGVSSTYQILKFAYIFIHVVGWAAIPYSPAKRCDSASQKQAQTFQETPLIAEASTMICTRPNFRAAPLFPNLDCNLAPLQPTESQYKSQN